ncbi:DNA-binding transcriptional MerR regulator [Cytobacillus eiseniae]|uniref:DNA-binding transcriptional MerR regulator n=1 Tax=Cytobacillus eiseniae TaxID=762947 RepID=A0ABS4R9W0_9BACI|nr:MerR family transcriptional regulator [Cytobacillus eiseniae]MBP2239680.1 DNA-binding transcriptional MerR regulator [Cytobacillus eiseniae]
MKSYTIKEVAKKLNVSAGKLRQWEKDLHGLLVIPRSKQGARFYTDDEISLLETVKQMHDKSLSKDMIRGIIEKDFQLKKIVPIEATLVPIVHDNLENEQNQKDLEQFLTAMKSWKDEMIDDVKNEIRTGIRKEVIEEVKKEIAKGSVHTVKTLSDSIYKSSEKTKEDIDNLASQVHTAAEHTAESIGTLSRRIAKTSKGTTEQIRTLSRRVSDSSEAAAEEFKTMIHYISSSAEVTHTEISALIETLNCDREIFLETINREREEYWHDVNQREVMFQDMILGFRNAAAAIEENKEAWWKFWK